MKRKERKVIYRVINAFASLILGASCAYLYFWGVSYIAIALITVSLLSIAAPVLVAGGDIWDMTVQLFEVFFHALIDAIIGVFEAIANLFSPFE